MSEVRGRSWEDPMPKEQRPRGITPRRRSGRKRQELSRVRGQGRWLGGATPRPQARGQGQRPGGPTPRPRSCGCACTGGPRGAIPG